MKYRSILPVMAIALVALLAAGSANVYAADMTGQRATIVQKLAQRFNLSEGDVGRVFDETLAEHKAEMLAHFQERLDQAVTNGKLTTNQKELILAKEAELQAERAQAREQFKNLTPAARRSAIKTKQQELRAWAKDNGIDMSYLLAGWHQNRPGHGPVRSS